MFSMTLPSSKVVTTSSASSTKLRTSHGRIITMLARTSPIIGRLSHGAGRSPTPAMPLLGRGVGRGTARSMLHTFQVH